MKKYEAPIAELEIFAVENIMDAYNEPAPCEDTPVCDDTPACENDLGLG